MTLELIHHLRTCAECNRAGSRVGMFCPDGRMLWLDWVLEEMRPPRSPQVANHKKAASNGE